MHFSVFDFVLSSTQAFNQVGMFFGAMACLGLGGLILVNSLYWRVHAVRALGTIIGVTTEKKFVLSSLSLRIARYADLRSEVR
jgi:hypothetical protein